MTCCLYKKYDYGVTVSAPRNWLDWELLPGLRPGVHLNTRTDIYTHRRLPTWMHHWNDQRWSCWPEGRSVWREWGWRAEPWSDLGLGKGRGRAPASQGSCCGLALPLSLAAPASEYHQNHQSGITLQISSSVEELTRLQSWPLIISTQKFNCLKWTIP